MPKLVTPPSGQQGLAGTETRLGSAPSQQGQRIAAHGQTIYVQQQTGVDPRWIAIASVTATVVALLFVAVVLWQYRNQPQPQPAPRIIKVNSGKQPTTPVGPQQSAVAAAPASSGTVAVTPSSTSTSVPAPVAATPTTPAATPASAVTPAAAAAPVAAAQPSAVAPVAVTPPAKPSPGNATPAVKREPPVASAAAGSSSGSAPRSAIPEAGEEVTKPVAPTRLGPVETAAAAPAAGSSAAPAASAAPAPEAPATADATRGAASKTAGTVVPWNEANQYMGKLITVEGTVVATRNTGSVCFLNFDKNWRDKFYVIVEPSVMNAWPKPPQEHFLNQKIRVTGKVSIYQDRPQMRITQADQITIVAE
jgi:hypothetical protein